MTLDKLKTYKKILILGYGAEGRATEKFLKKFHPTAEIGIADQKDDPDYLQRQKDYDLAIRTPLLRPKFLTSEYTTGTNLFFGNVENTIIGVTGTKGKSTTVSLLHHILKESGLPVRLYGNIGVPMIEALTEGISPDDIFILELSNYQLEDCMYSPHIACFLNIYEELHNHDSYEEYVTAKTNITIHQKPQDFFFYNGSQQQLAKLAQQSPAQTVDFTQVGYELSEGTLPFHTHLDNLKAVWALAKHMGVSEANFRTHIQTFTPLDHRMTNIGEYDGIRFYDDSGSVHPNSTILAVNTLKDIDTLILGGQDRGYHFGELAQTLAAHQVQNLILFPETGTDIEAEVHRISAYTPHMLHASTMEEAIAVAFDKTRPGKICLLSPGAPSYLMYDNLHERGLDFVSTIKRHAKGGPNEKSNSYPKD